MCNFNEKISEFYPGLRCQFVEDWQGYCAGNIVIVSKVVKNAYPGGVHKIIFDDGYVISSSTAQEVLVVQHLQFILSALEENNNHIQELRDSLEAAENYPQQLQNIFGDFARDIRVDESRVKALKSAIEVIEGRNEFLKNYERAVYSFIGKYAKPEMIQVCRSSVNLWHEGLFEINFSLKEVTFGRTRLFAIDKQSTKFPADNPTADCIQKAFQAELDAVGLITCREQGFGL